MPENIEHSLGLTHPTVSSILNRLEEKKLIMTEPLESDRRYKKLVLTDKSSAMTTAIEEKIGKITERIFAGLSMDEIESLSGVIKN